MSAAPSRSDLQRLAHLVADSVSAFEAWSRLLLFFQSRGVELNCRLGALDILKAVKEVAEQLSAVIRKEPIPPEVTFLCFGLFDAPIAENEMPRAGFYVSGGVFFDPSDQDTLCDLAYFPEERILNSSLLNSVMSLGWGDVSVQDFIEYTAIFGVAALLAKFSVPRNLCHYRLVVGFDEGDFAEITQ